jgi:hypothetical protein
MASVDDDDYDSPWKDILERYLAEFFAFFAPVVYAEIDWTQIPVFLNSELRQVARDAELGRRLADKLVQVWRRDGSDAWVLIHIEIQGQHEREFARRMFTYAYRIFDRYQRPVMSLAVLGDERHNWRPSRFRMELWGCETRFTFPLIKLRDYRRQWAALVASRNPFATVVMTHLTAQATRQNPVQRARLKLDLMRRLYRLGYSREDVIALFHFIDWLLRLPDELAAQFWHALQTIEEVQQMPYISSVERIGIQKGLIQGREEGREEGLMNGLRTGIELGMELRFGSAGQELLPTIRAISNLSTIEAIYTALKGGASLEQIRQFCILPEAE